MFLVLPASDLIPRGFASVKIPLRLCDCMLAFYVEEETKSIV